MISELTPEKAVVDCPDELATALSSQQLPFIKSVGTSLAALARLAAPLKPSCRRQDRVKAFDACQNLYMPTARSLAHLCKALCPCGDRVDAPRWVCSMAAGTAQHCAAARASCGLAETAERRRATTNELSSLYQSAWASTA
jgi:hypothetical protein